MSASGVSTRLLRAWTWAFGELPDPDPDERSDGLTLLVAGVGALALYFGSKHKPGSPALADGTWTLLVFGALPLVAVVGWDLGRRGRLAHLAGTATVVGTICWRILADRVRKRLLTRAWLMFPSTVGALGLLLVAAWRGGIDLRRWGLGAGDTVWWRTRLALGLGAVVLIACLGAGMSPAMLEYYPNSALARGSIRGLVQAQLYVLLYMAGWEFFYRGFLLFGLARRDPLLAVLFQAMPFYLMHRGKPSLEMLSSFVGGVGLGWFSLRAGSIWPAVLLHCALTSVMEVLAYAVRALAA